MNILKQFNNWCKRLCVQIKKYKSILFINLSGDRMAILTFNLQDDKPDFEDAINGSYWKFVVVDLEHYLRNEIKYNDSLSKEDDEAFSKVREKLYELVSEKGLDLFN